MAKAHLSPAEKTELYVQLAQVLRNQGSRRVPMEVVMIQSGLFDMMPKFVFLLMNEKRTERQDSKATRVDCAQTE